MNPMLTGNVLLLSNNQQQVKDVRTFIEEELENPERLVATSPYNASIICGPKDFRVLVVPFELPIPNMNGVQLIRKLHRQHKLPDHVVLACTYLPSRRYLQRLPVHIEIVADAWNIKNDNLRRRIVSCMLPKAVIIHAEGTHTSPTHEVLSKKFHPVYQCSSNGIGAFLHDRQNLADLVVFMDVTVGDRHAQDIIDELVDDRPRFPKHYIIMVGGDDEVEIRMDPRITITAVGKGLQTIQLQRIVDDMMREGRP